MSGPIVRRYGFPNFEKIFGERPIEHGTDEPEAAGPDAGEKAPAESKPRPASSKEAAKPGEKAS